MRVVSHASTHVGRRKNNEDSFCAIDRFGLYVVADGMGGYEGGEVASRIVVDTLTKFFERTTPSGAIGLGAGGDGTAPVGGDDCAIARERIDLALRMAHREIARRRVGPLARMGTTVALVVLQEGRALIAHVGDSRVYRLRGGRFEALTRDHSLYAEMEAAGTMSLPPRQQCSFQHVITRALGAPGNARADVRCEEALLGDLFVVASDGLTDVMSDEAIASYARKEDVRVLADRLVQAAWNAGADDNVTVVVAQVVG